jgi:hypothetical protein
MLLKIGKMTPQCPERLPSDEYTGKSWLPGGEYYKESWLPSDEYTVENWLHCDEYRGVDFLVYFKQASEQLYEINFLVSNRPGSQVSPVY